jgi:hypothetical protein
MNCAECREHLVALAEGLLEVEQAQTCRVHLDTCTNCRVEYGAVSRLQERLLARGRVASEVTMVAPVMRRVRNVQAEREGSSFMTKLFSRWGYGLGAVAGAAAVVLLILTTSPKAHATAAEVMAKGVKAMAKLSSVHLRGQLRTLPADNFGYVDSKQEFYPIELWKQFQPELKWRVEKPGRVAVMNGQTTLLFLKPSNLAMKFPQPSTSAFDTDWLQRIANLSDAIENELQNARAKGWKMSLAQETANDGRSKSLVTVNAKAGLPDNDYLKNKFFDMSDTRRVYRFDNETERLESVQVYMATGASEVQVFELTRIEYNQPIEDAVFQFELPANVNWYQEPQKLPDNEKYAAMSPEQAARAFFEACGAGNWTEVAKFEPIPLNDQIRSYLEGLQVVSLGTPFTSTGNNAQFVPYEIKFKSGETKKHNLALKKDPRTDRWFVDGGF